MARIETDPNYSTPTFSRATAGTDLFKKTDVQQLAEALSTHTHGAGTGLAVTRLAAGVTIPSGTITADMIADGTITTADIAANALTTRASTFVMTAAGGMTTSSSTFSTIPFMDTAIVSSGGDMLWMATYTWYLGGTGQVQVSLGLSVDGGVDNAIYRAQEVPSGEMHAQTLCFFIQGLAAGSHTVHARWAVTGTGATITINQTSFQVIIVEFKR